MLGGTEQKCQTIHFNPLPSFYYPTVDYKVCFAAKCSIHVGCVSCKTIAGLVGFMSVFV